MPETNDAALHLASSYGMERTFATARALVSELALRAPSHPSLPALRTAPITTPWG